MSKAELATMYRSEHALEAKALCDPWIRLVTVDEETELCSFDNVPALGGCGEVGGTRSAA
jgi:hypothetical protein